MKTTARALAAGTLFAPCLAICSPKYAVTDLGNLPSAYDALPLAINDSGTIVGTTNTPFETAFKYEGGAMTAIPTPAGLVYGTANGINDSGEIVGVFSGSGQFSAYYTNGSSVNLLPSGGPTVMQSVAGVNNSGLIVGANANFVASIFSGGLFTNIGGALTTLGSYCTAVNDSGHVVGDYYTPFGGAVPTFGFYYDGVTATPLSSLSGAIDCHVAGINNSDEIIGTSDLASGYTRSFVDVGGVFTDLGALSKFDVEVDAFGINNAGQIVGDSGGLAMIYQSGTMLDLNTMLDPITSSGWFLGEATAINNQGQIVGVGQHNGTYSAFLLTPLATPEPSCYGLVGAAGLLALRRRGYRKP
jgi:probable HAF family extracellular repeat protein